MEESIIYYYQPNIQQKSEAAFFEALQTHYPNSITRNEHFLVPQFKLNQFLNVQNMIHWLECDTYIPAKKRLACIEILHDFPSKFLRIAFQPTEISFDFVGVINDKAYYWEFHEKQHVRLSVDRPKRVYTPEGDPVTVPRYFQRLMRDLWCISFFEPYTIVWKTWFETEKATDECFEFAEGFREFHLEEKFFFKGFIYQ